MKTTLEKIQVSDDLVYKIQISPDEENLYLHVDFMDGRFIIEKIFRNNYDGLEDLKNKINLFNTEAKIISYLNIEGVEGVKSNAE